MIIVRGRLCDLSRDRLAAFRILLSVGPQKCLTRSRSGLKSGRVFGPYGGDGFELFRFSTTAPDISRGTVPAYDFRIRINSQIVGQVNLRVGLTEHIMLYAGNLGYKVDPPYRGRHLAARAINLLLPVARHHQMDELWICCNPENLASRKTCERVGAKLVEIIEVPPGNDLHGRGDRANCRYRLRL